jgi:hypothetical protein
VSTHRLSFDSASSSEVAISTSLSTPGFASAPEYTVLLPLPPPAPQVRDGAGNVWSLAPPGGSFPRFPWGSALLVLVITANVSGAAAVPSVTGTDASGSRLFVIGATPNVGAPGTFTVTIPVPINALGAPSRPSMTLVVKWPQGALVTGERVQIGEWQPAAAA